MKTKAKREKEVKGKCGIRTFAAEFNHFSTDAYFKFIPSELWFSMKVQARLEMNNFRAIPTSGLIFFLLLVHRIMDLSI